MHDDFNIPTSVFRCGMLLPHSRLTLDQAPALSHPYHCALPACIAQLGTLHEDFNNNFILNKINLVSGCLLYKSLYITQPRCAKELHSCVCASCV